MGSTRLPGKVLLPLAGKPMLERVVQRLGRARTLNAVVIATSTLPSDDPIAELCALQGWTCFRGSEHDVLDRYLGAAHAAGADAVVRITSDCPLIDPGLVDQLVTEFQCRQPSLDYACNFHPTRTFPRGLDAEIFRMDVLERCHREAEDPASREHVTAFIYQHPERFSLHGMASANDHSGLRWTVDTQEDFTLAVRIYEHFGDASFDWNQVIALLDQHPEWPQINAHVQQKPL